jgi:hypothetical protein
MARLEVMSSELVSQIHNGNVTGGGRGMVTKVTGITTVSDVIQSEAGLIIFAEHHLLSQATPPLHEYTALTYACKATYALLAKRLQEHKWKTFQPKFLQQLDFVDRFKTAYSISKNDSDTIILGPRRQHTGHTCIHALVQRKWDFVKETVTVTVRTIHEATEWESSYTYDNSLSEQSNFESIDRHMRLAIRHLTQEFNTPKAPTARAVAIHRMIMIILFVSFAKCCWIVRKCF